MDEADLLGDRIAIMSRGTLRVVGSSLFLKGRFGIGYHLVVATAPVDGVATASHDAVTRLVRSFIPLAAVEDAPAAGANELCMVLPLESIPQFAALFGALEEQQASLGVESYGVSVTSLEEVFLRLAEAVDAAERNEPPAGASPDAAHGRGTSSTGSKPARSTSCDVDIASLGRVSLMPAVASPVGADNGYSGADASSSLAAASGGSYKPKREAMDVEVGGVPDSSRSTSVHGGGSLKTILQTLSQRTTVSASFWSQAKTQLWRRYKQATRDRRGLFLQCVFPLIFVCVSFVFRSLNNVDLKTNLRTFYMQPSQLTDVGGSVTVPWLVNASGPAVAWVDAVNAAMAATGGQGVPATPNVNRGVVTWTNLEQDVLGNMTYAAAVLVFNPGSLSLFDLTVMVNTSFTNVAPIVVSAFNTGLMRSLEGDDGASIMSGFMPFERVGMVEGGKGDRFCVPCSLRCCGVAAVPFPVTGRGGQQCGRCMGTVCVDDALCNRCPCVWCWLLSCGAESGKTSVGQYLSSAFMGFYLSTGFCMIPALQVRLVCVDVLVAGNRYLGCDDRDRGRDRGSDNTVAPVVVVVLEGW